MQRALLMFILYMTIIVPTYLSRDAKPQRAMKRTWIVMFVLTVIWSYSCRTYFYRLSDD